MKKLLWELHLEMLYFNYKPEYHYQLSNSVQSLFLIRLRIPNINLFINKRSLVHLYTRNFCQLRRVQSVASTAAAKGAFGIRFGCRCVFYRNVGSTAVTVIKPVAGPLTVPVAHYVYQLALAHCWPDETAYIYIFLFFFIFSLFVCLSLCWDCNF